MTRLATLVVAHPIKVIAVTLAITALWMFVIVTRGLEFNGSPESLSSRDGALEFYNRSRDVFGDDRPIIVGVTTGKVFSPEFLRQLADLTNRLALVDGVEETISLSNIRAIRRDQDGAVIERLIPPSPDFETLARLEQEVLKDPLYVSHYISKDGRTAGINVFLRRASAAQGRAVAEEVERVAKESAGEHELFLAGIPIMDARGINSMVRDMLVCSPVAALLCFLVFLIVFRSLWCAVLPTAVLAIGIIWVLGLMSLMGREITIATLSLPTVLIAVGSSYMFHILNQYRISMAGLKSDVESVETIRAAWLRGLTFIFPTLIVSGTTTMAGFGSLASSPVLTVRDMGIFQSVGVLAMVTLSLAFIPAMLSALRPRSLGHRGDSGSDYASKLNRYLAGITALILYRRKTVLIVSIIATAIAGSGAVRLKVNTDYLRIFPESSEVAVSARMLHERLSGAATVHLVVTGPGGMVADQQFLDSLRQLSRYATSQPGVDSALSIADIVERVQSVLQSDQVDLKRLFDNYLAGDPSLSRLVSTDLSSAVLILRTNLFSSNELRTLTTRLESRARDLLPEEAEARSTGAVVLLNEASDAVATSQVYSLSIALVTIYLMMVAMFRSFSTAITALFPNLLPIVGYFGFLGWTGTHLDITTSLIASAVLGLAVDNAVHMIRRYRQCDEERKRKGLTDPGWALWLTMVRSGKPMVLANLMLIAAFLVFMLSSFVPVRIGGLLWAVTIFVCLLANLIFLPAIMDRYSSNGRRPG